MDPALAEVIRQADPTVEVEVVARLVDPEAAPRDLRVVTRFGAVVTGRVRAGRLAAVRSDPRVRSLKAPRPLGQDVLRPAGAGWLPGDLVGREPRRETGAGVVVAALDWGLDVTHPSFRRADGSTRVLALWDQTATGSTSPYGYGRVHRRTDIDAALRTPDPHAALGYRPGISAHGSHVLSIAAGTPVAGRGRARPLPAGVAPGADLVFVHLSAGPSALLATLGDSVRLLEALDFVAREAGDRPWVCNASLGRTGGPHDGTTLVEQAIDHLVAERPGRAVVGSCGNYRSSAGHASGRLAAGTHRTLGWRIARRATRAHELEVWYPGSDRFGARLRGPDGAVAATASLGEVTDIRSGGRVVGRMYHRSHDPNNGDHHLDVFLFPEATPGRWSLALTGERVEDGRFHAWIERDAASGSRFDPRDVDHGSTTNTVCNGRRYLAVGAYDPHAPTRPLARFSSVGPTRDGRVKPDLLAPGCRVLGARSGPGARRVRKSGTSMAAPHVTGAVALLFEAAGRPLGIDETRRVLVAACRPVAGHPGPGRLDPDAALRSVRGSARARTPGPVGSDPRDAETSDEDAEDDVKTWDIGEADFSAWGPTVGLPHDGTDPETGRYGWGTGAESKLWSALAIRCAKAVENEKVKVDYLDLAQRWDIVRRVSSAKSGTGATWDLHYAMHLAFPTDPKTRACARNRPLVVILPGAHSIGAGVLAVSDDLADPANRCRSWVGFVGLQRELARHGIASAALDCSGADLVDAELGMRLRLLERYLRFLWDLGTGWSDAGGVSLEGGFDFAKLGVLGHSRGGDAAIAAAAEFARGAIGLEWGSVADLAPGEEAFRPRFRGVFALSPTDSTGGVPSDATVSLREGDTDGLFVLWGSADGDVLGMQEGGGPFSHLDRATCPWSGVLASDYTHGRFNTQWTRVPDHDKMDGRAKARSGTVASAPSRARHEALLAGYAVPFFRVLLGGESDPVAFSDGSRLPEGIGGEEVSTQWCFRASGVLDDFAPDDPTAAVLVHDLNRRSLVSDVGTWPIGAFGDVWNRPFGSAPIVPVMPHQAWAVRATPSAERWVRVVRTEVMDSLEGFGSLTLRLAFASDHRSRADLAASPLPELRVVLEVGEGRGTRRVEVGEEAFDDSGGRGWSRPTLRVSILGSGEAERLVNSTVVALQTRVLPLGAFPASVLGDVRAIEVHLGPRSAPRPLWLATIALEERP